MRGGVSINDLLDRYTNEDVDIMTAIVNENIEATKNARMPLI
jgi:hypothetical protein